MAADAILQAITNFLLIYAVRSRAAYGNKYYSSDFCAFAFAMMLFFDKAAMTLKPQLLAAYLHFADIILL